MNLVVALTPVATVPSRSGVVELCCVRNSVHGIGRSRQVETEGRG
jgi:hypothetical protein